MAALEDFLNTPPPNPTVDPTTMGLIHGYQANSQNTTPGIINGIDAPQFNQAAASTRQGTALGGQDQTDSVAAALNARNSKASTDFVNNLKSNISMNAPVRQMAASQQSLQNLQGVNQVQQANYQIQKQQWLNEQRVQIYRQQQQNSILAGILGIVGAGIGTVVGAAVGGGPGAVAGAALGSKL